MAKGAAAASAAEPIENDTPMDDVQEPVPEISTSTEQPSQDPPAADPSKPSEPAPPLELIPGPRAQKFLEVHVAALSKVLSTISARTFSACFPTIAASAPDVLASIHSQFISRLKTFAEADLKEILRERKVVANLNGLDELILDAKRRKANAEKGGAQDEDAEKPLPGHLQGAENLLEAHLIGTLEGARSKLNAREQTLQSKNKMLFESVQEQYREVEELTRGLEGLVADLKGCGELVQDV